MRWLLAALLFLGAAQAYASDISSTNWSEIAASNSAAPPNGWPPSMAPSQVEPTAREGMSAVKRWYNHINATKTSGGSANVHTLTYTVAPAAYVSGDCYTFIAGFTNSGATTLNVNGLGAKAVKVGSAALTGNEIKAGQVVIACYDGTNFQLTTGNFLVGLIAPVTTGAITQILTGGGTGPTTWSTVTGPLTIGGGALAITIPNASFLGGDGTDFVGLTGTQATALLNNFTSGLKGLVPLSGGGTSNYLRADGSWSPPVGTGSGITQLTGDCTAGPGTGSQALTCANTAVTPGSYTNSSITVDSKGRITSASSGTIIKPLAIGWPAGIDPTGNIVATVRQASTLVAVTGSVTTPVGATATVTLYRAPSGTACASGSDLTTAAMNANGTANTNQTFTVKNTALSAGDRLCLVTTDGSNWTGGVGIGGLTAEITTP